MTWKEPRNGARRKDIGATNREDSSRKKKRLKVWIGSCQIKRAMEKISMAGGRLGKPPRRNTSLPLRKKRALTRVLRQGDGGGSLSKVGGKKGGRGGRKIFSGERK